MLKIKSIDVKEIAKTVNAEWAKGYEAALDELESSATNDMSQDEIIGQVIGTVVSENKRFTIMLVEAIVSALQARPE